MNASVIPGFFGKLPSNGDFLQRRVQQEFVDRWDVWLQEAVHASKQALGSEWLNFYLAAPIWRFVLAEGACGSGAYAGIMVPSVDRVGRYFPLTIVQQIDVHWNPLDISVCWASWFEALERCALHALDTHDLRLEQFEDNLAGVPRAVDIALPATLDVELFGNLAFPVAHLQWRVGLLTPEHLQLDIALLAYRELHKNLRPVTLWWTSGSEQVAPCWLTACGLPKAEGFTALLNGSFDRGGWSTANPALQSQIRPSVHQASVAVAPAAAVVDTRALTAAARLPTNRPSDVEGNRAAFVVRPEIGLWAIVTPGAQQPVPATRMVADALRNVEAEASLTLQVERVREALQNVNRQILAELSRTPPAPCGTANVLTFVMQNAECALIYSGDVQAVRKRERAVGPVLGNGDSSGETNDGLLSLLNSSPTRQPCGSAALTSIPVAYDRTLPGDVWVLCGNEQASSGVINDLSLDDVDGEAGVQQWWQRSVGATTAVLPLVALEVRAS